MMEEQGCTYRNPLPREGVSQSDRSPAALDPDYVQVDERSLADLLRRLIGLSEEVDYYNLENSISGDWRPFFENDLTSVIALMMAGGTEAFRESLDAIEEALHDDTLPDRELREAFKVLFDMIATMACRLDGWYRRSPEGYAVHNYLRQNLTVSLRVVLREAVAFFKAAEGEENLLDPSYVDDGTWCREKLRDFATLAQADLHSDWMVPSHGEEDWATYYREIAADHDIYLADEDGLAYRLREGFPSVLRIVNAFAGAVRKARDRSPEFIRETLERNSSHEPHMGLLLAFLQLFRHAQDRINSLGRRHLNFHYEEVLHLKRREAVPDRVYLLGELAKHAKRHRLEEGTLFKAGKDAAGKEVLYRTVREVVLNKAQVASLRSVFVDMEHRWQVYDKPRADSSDGTGGELEQPAAGWKAFGESQLTGEGGGLTYLEDIPGRQATMRLSEVGFALSAPVLYLAEGRRNIEVRLHGRNLPREASFYRAELFECRLSSPEGWIDVDRTPDAGLSVRRGSGGEMVLDLTLPGGAPPVSSWDEAVHGGRYQTPWPVLKFILKAGDPDAYGYRELKEARLDRAEIVTRVEDMKNLVLQNELGLLDPTKPFQPFGTEPAVGSAFYLGSREIFSKQLSSLDLHIDWHKLPDDLEAHYNYGSDFQPAPHSFKAKLEVLQGGSWQPAGDNEKAYRNLFETVREQLLGQIGKTTLPDNIILTAPPPGGGFPTGPGAPGSGMRPLSLETGVPSSPMGLDPGTIPGPGITPVRPLRMSEPVAQRSDMSFTTGNAPIGMSPDPGLEDFERLGVSQKRGFARLVLKQPEQAFGHEIYTTLLTERVMKKQKYLDTELPNRPYTPVMRSLSVDYTASETVRPYGGASLEERKGRFYHLLPFGDQEVHEELPSSPGSSLLPRFRHEGKGGDLREYQGEFYIGIADLRPPQQLSLLFRVAEGSADPGAPRQQLDWFYLSTEGWKKFRDRQLVHESTNGLLTTGIIRFNVPGDITADSPRFPGSLHWIKAAVRRHPEAVCRVVDVRAQAFTAEFADRGNDPDFLASALPAGTVAKAKESRSELKGVQQPYASEGGRVREKDDAFHRRASERLRHKDRGVTMWDYERLVLQRFPEIYKAKCINHGTYEYLRNGHSVSSEFAPGYVTLVVVPDLRNKNAVDPLKPRMSQNSREEVRQFLAGKISPFAARRLQVVNPLFEQVKVEFKVSFYGEVDAGYYQQQLEEDIMRFLSPWAWEEGEDLSFGGGMHRSLILNFVEERPYVDYVTDFRMKHLVEGEIHDGDASRIETTTARSVLVSHPSHGVRIMEVDE